MRKLILIAIIALTGSLVLSACNKDGDGQQAGAQASAKVTKPTDPNDSQAWNAYLGQIVQNNMEGMKADRPYPYLVPAGDSEDDVARRDRQLSNVGDTVARGVLPGNMLVFAGADSSKTADFIIAAFTDAKPGSFKDVIIMFIGDKADEQRVDDVLKPTGATPRFVEM